MRYLDSPCSQSIDSVSQGPFALVSLTMMDTIIMLFSRSGSFRLITKLFSILCISSVALRTLR